MSTFNGYPSALERRLGDFSAAAQYAAGEVKTAPRITPADIEAEIVSESYFTAADGVMGASKSDHALLDEYVTYPGSPLSLVTFCVLVLKNGTKVVGINYGPVSPENFDPQIAIDEARKAAVEQIWPLLGYELRSKLSRTDPDYRMLLKEIPMSVIADFVDDNDAIKGMISPAKAD